MDITPDQPITSGSSRFTSTVLDLARATAIFRTGRDPAVAQMAPTAEGGGLPVNTQAQAATLVQTEKPWTERPEIIIGIVLVVLLLRG